MHSCGILTMDSEDVHFVLEFKFCKLILDPWSRGREVIRSVVTSNPTHLNTSLLKLSIL